MKEIKKIKNSKVPLVAIDTKLDKLRDKILFPKKLDLANKMLENAKLPQVKHHKQ